jgi:flagellin
MSLRINTNLPAQEAWRQSNRNDDQKDQSLKRLASGKRINSAADDAAGLAISEKMQGQIGGLDQANNDTADGLNMLKTAEGSMSQTSSVLQQMNQLAVQAGNDTLTASDRGAIQTELNQLSAQVDTNATQTQFNGKKTNDGTLQNANIQIGANAGQGVSVSISSQAASTLNVNTASIQVGTQAQAQTTLTNVQNAINTVSTNRAQIGAQENNFGFIQQNQATQSENVSAANSRISDLDMANESIKLATSGILGNSSLAMLAQANSSPQSVARLLA